MSMPPQMIAQLLQSQGSPQGQQGIQGSTNAPAAADLMKKIMMIQALKNQGQQPLAGQPPNSLGGPQGGLNAAPQIPGQMTPQQMMQLQNPQGPGAQNA
jgi:hypothetical protein